MDDLTHAVWCKSSHSGDPHWECVEVANLVDGDRAIRDSKAPTGPKLQFAPAEWAAFTTGVRDGEFDGPDDQQHR